MTQTTNIDWNRAAQVTGVVVVTLAKATCWTAKKVGIGLFAVMTALFKVFMAFLSFGVSHLDPKPYDHQEHAADFEPGIDSNGDIVHTGVRRKIHY